MTPDEALSELLDRVAANWAAGGLITAQELSGWPDAVVAVLRRAKLIRKTKPAVSAICPGCERECAMPVHSRQRGGGESGHFVVCDKRSDTNRVNIPLEQLAQWKCSVESVGEFLAAQLDFHCRGWRSADGKRLEVGELAGDVRSQMLCLSDGPKLMLVVGANSLPVSDVVAFQGDELRVDATRLRRMVDAAEGDPRHTPTTVKRDARKLATRERHQRWQKAYRKLKSEKPGHSKTWYSQQIAKSPDGEGFEAETIRKNM